MTEEGKAKALTKKFLDAEGLIPAGKAALAKPGHIGWYHLPVSNGMGVHGIPDLLGHYRGRFFVIETKILGKDPTALQRLQINAITLTSAAAFVVRCAEDLEEIRAWMHEVDRTERFLAGSRCHTGRDKINE